MKPLSRRRFLAGAAGIGVAWSDGTARALAGVAADPRQLVTLALIAPESVLA